MENNGCICWDVESNMKSVTQVWKVAWVWSLITDSWTPMRVDWLAYNVTSLQHTEREFLSVARSRRVKQMKLKPTSVAIPGTVPFEIFSGKPTGGYKCLRHLGPKCLKTLRTLDRKTTASYDHKIFIITLLEWLWLFQVTAGDRTLARALMSL